MADPEMNYSVEYYRSFAGYDLPLQLTDRTTKEDALAREMDAAFYIGYFDNNRRLVRVVKMLHGTIMFEHKYFYHANGKLMRKEGRNMEGVHSVQEFDESGNLITK